MVSDPAVLMSIRPNYADAILDGTKTVELRRRRPSFPPGTRVLIYSSAPDQRVTGMFVTGRVLAAPPPVLWRGVARRAGVARAHYDDYFAGSETAYAIEIIRAHRIRPRALGVRPPQSYLLLRAGEPRHRPLLELVHATTPPLARQRVARPVRALLHGAASLLTGAPWVLRR